MRSRAAIRDPERKVEQPFLKYIPPGARVGDPGENSETRVRDSVAALPQGSVHALLQRWAETLLSGHVNAHLKLYAPTLERFGDRTNIGRQSIRSFKEGFIAQLRGATQFELHAVRVKRTTLGAEIDFRIGWEGRSGMHSSAHRLKVRQDERTLRIVAEEELHAQRFESRSRVKR
jgi:hypothetical protein